MQNTVNCKLYLKYVKIIYTKGGPFCGAEKVHDREAIPSKKYEKTPTMVSFRTWHASVDVKRRKDTSVSETQLGVE